MKAVAGIIGVTTLLFLPQPAAAPAGGPEGFGAATPGGRGGREIAVTTPADAGPGSFRAAVTAPGPRIVRFAVAGLITLESPVVIAEPYLTLDGQGAPGDGVCIRGSEVVVRTHDVIVRHMRFRPGDIGKEVDALNIAATAITCSWITCRPPGRWRNAVGQRRHARRDHPVEHHRGRVEPQRPRQGGARLRIAGARAGGVTLHHNLWAHNDSRNPRLGDNYGREPFPTFDVRNNVIYDYGAIASGMTGDHLSANYVANYIRPGPSSNRTRGPIVLTDTAAVRYFVRDNVVEGRDELTNDNARLFDRRELDGRSLFTLAPQAFAAPPVRTTSAVEAPA